MYNTRANLNLLAVSLGTREAAINTEQDCDVSLLVGVDDYFNIDPRREDNSNEMTGKEEPDTVYDLGALASTTLNFNKLQPHQALFLLAYGLGNCSTAPAGDGYLHTITPIAGDLDLLRSNPSFTAAQRIAQTIVKRRFASCFVDSVTLDFNEDDWVKGTGGIKATGKRTDSVVEETVVALDNVTSLALESNGVQGATAAERLDNVQVVRAAESGSNQYEICTVTEVSDATPAVLTIESLGGGGEDSLNYKILYVPTEAAWCTFPARLTETPMRVSQTCLYVGGGWSGSAFVGGQAMGSVLTSLQYQLNNNYDIKFSMCAGGTYAGRVWRGGRTQALKLNRKTRDYLLQNYILQNETLGVHLLCEGAEFDTGHKYTLELIFPKVAVLTAPFSSDNGRVAEAGDLKVLEHDTYGSVICRVKNLVETVAAEPA